VAYRSRVVPVSSGGRGFLKNMEELYEPPVVEKLEYTLPLGIVEYPDPRLRAENAEVGVFDETVKTLATEMFEIMYKTMGVGLAAPQVGVNVRMLVYNPEGYPGKGEEVVMINPRILKLSKATDKFDEGCLSFPEMLGIVERPVKCKVEYRDVTGKKRVKQLSDWEARIVQHEYDHLDGKLFHDRMTEDVLLEVQPQLKGFEDKFSG